MHKIKYIVGIDEAGRGPLAGPVSVGAFAVSVEWQNKLSGFFPKGKVKDSKKLSSQVRENIFNLLQVAKGRSEISYAVSFSSAELIDRKGISFSIRQALARSLTKLGIAPGSAQVLLDGSLSAPAEFLNQRTIIKGDEKESVIALASIVAKVSRDRKMKMFAKKYPEYGFEVHKGYGTREHCQYIKKHGLSPIHRRSFTKKFAK
ncbi:MAG: ribonuclease HII [Patescibacteria group bacterium]